VDNNSAEEMGVREYLKSITGNKYTKDIKLVFNDNNQGVAGGRNSALVVATGDYLFNMDDDLLVPDNYDHSFIEACDKIPKLGVVGISVEPIKFPVITINGVQVRSKTVGNINGIALCLPRRVFQVVGYYDSFGTNLYSHEDAFLSYKLRHLGLIGVYILKKGIHLDTDKDKVYRAVKNKAHVKNSPELQSLALAIAIMKKTGNVYTPYVKFDHSKQPEKYGHYDNNMILNDRKKK
jgi:GT2 family glycosyltransferase